MRTYTQAIQATRIDLIHFTERPRPVSECSRCGTKVKHPRPGGMCRSCRDVVSFERAIKRAGIDLSALADDEFVIWRRNDNRRYVVVVHESELEDEGVAA